MIESVQISKINHELNEILLEIHSLLLLNPEEYFFDKTLISNNLLRYDFVEMKVFCVCNSFVTRNEGSREQKPTKNVCFLFRPGSECSALLNVLNTMALSQKT